MLLAHHVLERDVLSSLGLAGDQTGVLLREETLGNDDEQDDRGRQRGEEDSQCHQPEAQGEVENELVAVEHRIEHALAGVEQTSVMFRLPVRLQEARGHHRGQRQRDERGHHDRHRKHDGEFPEQAADDAAHQQQRDQHRDQRERDREDGKPDFAGALERGCHRTFALLDIACDVFQHDDGVVDDEAHGNRQRHQ